MSYLFEMPNIFTETNHEFRIFTANRIVCLCNVKSFRSHSFVSRGSCFEHHCCLNSNNFLFPPERSVYFHVFVSFFFCSSNIHTRQNNEYHHVFTYTCHHLCELFHHALEVSCRFGINVQFIVTLDQKEWKNTLQWNNPLTYCSNLIARTYRQCCKYFWIHFCEWWNRVVDRAMTKRHSSVEYYALWLLFFARNVPNARYS